MFKTLCFVLCLFGSLWSDPPISVYLTWQHDPCTTMTVQWITASHHSSNQVEYRLPDDTVWVVEHGSHRALPEGVNYHLHRIELERLKPDQEYVFRIPGQDGLYKFKTLPETLSKALTFVVGGDIYHDSLLAVQQTNEQAAKQNPSFALLGGDLAYSGNRIAWAPEDRQRWLDWLSRWTREMVNGDGCLIPIIPAIGNHDCKGGFYQEPHKASFFYALFPFPGPNGYNVLDAGNYLSLFIMDSSITHPIEGEQTLWLHHVLAGRRHIPHKFALYHVPAYPSVRPFNFKLSLMVRRFWVPIFEKFNLTAAFENHEHAYKRTFPILQNRRDAQGVLYLGDGAWGVLHPRIPKPPRQAWYIAKSAAVRHVLVVTLEKEKRTYRAIDFTGQVIDEFIQ